MSVRVLGQGYVGLPLALLAAESGFDVVGIELDDEKVRRLLAGNSYVDDVPDSRLRAAIRSGRYAPSGETSRIAGFDVAVISVPTPLANRKPDLKYVEAAAASIAPHIRSGVTVIVESTTFPGTTEEFVRPLLESASGLQAGKDFHLGYSPERIDPGNAAWPLESIPKVVSGIDGASLTAVKGFFESLGIATVPAHGTREAELAKLLENTFRHVNIALVNEIAMFAHELDIDVWEALRVASTKPFGFMPFFPGPGVGGHCIPIDPHYFSWSVEDHLGRSCRFVDLATDINDRMPEYVAQRVAAGLDQRGLPLKGRVVLLLGLAYKADTPDTRESPTYRIAALLQRDGADVVVVDQLAPQNATPRGATRAAGSRADLERADAVVLLVDHANFDLSVLASLPGFILDCRGATSYDNVERL